MFKRILKIVGLVFLSAAVLVGLSFGVLAIMGRFKEKPVHPEDLYFEYNELLISTDPDNNTQQFTFKVLSNTKDVNQNDIMLDVKDGKDVISVPVNAKIGTAIPVTVATEGGYPVGGIATIRATDSRGIVQTTELITIYVDVPVSGINIANPAYDGSNPLSQPILDAEDSIELMVGQELPLSAIATPEHSLKPINIDKFSKKSVEYYILNEIDKEVCDFKDTSKTSLLAKHSGAMEITIATFPTYAVQSKVEAMERNNPLSVIDRLDYMVKSTYTINVKVITATSISVTNDDINMYLYEETSLVLNSSVEGKKNLKIEIKGNDNKPIVSALKELQLNLIQIIETTGARVNVNKYFDIYNDTKLVDGVEQIWLNPAKFENVAIIKIRANSRFKMEGIVLEVSYRNNNDTVLAEDIVVAIEERAVTTFTNTQSAVDLVVDRSLGLNHNSNIIDLADMYIVTPANATFTKLLYFAIPNVDNNGDGATNFDDLPIEALDSKFYIHPTYGTGYLIGYQTSSGEKVLNKIKVKSFDDTDPDAWAPRGSFELFAVRVYTNVNGELVGELIGDDIIGTKLDLFNGSMINFNNKDLYDRETNTTFITVDISYKLTNVNCDIYAQINNVVGGDEPSITSSGIETHYLREKFAINRAGNQEDTYAKLIISDKEKFGALSKVIDNYSLVPVLYNNNGTVNTTATSTYVSYGTRKQVTDSVTKQVSFEWTLTLLDKLPAGTYLAFELRNNINTSIRFPDMTASSKPNNDRIVILNGSVEKVEIVTNDDVSILANEQINRKLYIDMSMSANAMAYSLRYSYTNQQGQTVSGTKIIANNTNFLDSSDFKVKMTPSYAMNTNYSIESLNGSIIEIGTGNKINVTGTGTASIIITIGSIEYRFSMIVGWAAGVSATLRTQFLTDNTKALSGTTYESFSPMKEDKLAITSNNSNYTDENGDKRANRVNIFYSSGGTNSLRNTLITRCVISSVLDSEGREILASSYSGVFAIAKVDNVVTLNINQNIISDYFITIQADAQYMESEYIYIHLFSAVDVVKNTLQFSSAKTTTIYPGTANQKTLYADYDVFADTSWALFDGAALLQSPIDIHIAGYASAISGITSAVYSPLAADRQSWGANINLTIDTANNRIVFGSIGTSLLNNFVKITLTFFNDDAFDYYLYILPNLIIDYDADEVTNGIKNVYSGESFSLDDVLSLYQYKTVDTLSNTILYTKYPAYSIPNDKFKNYTGAFSVLETGNDLIVLLNSKTVTAGYIHKNENSIIKDTNNICVVVHGVKQTVLKVLVTNPYLLKPDSAVFNKSYLLGSQAIALEDLLLNKMGLKLVTVMYDEEKLIYSGFGGQIEKFTMTAYGIRFKDASGTGALLNIAGENQNVFIRTAADGKIYLFVATNIASEQILTITLRYSFNEDDINFVLTQNFDILIKPNIPSYIATDDDGNPYTAFSIIKQTDKIIDIEASSGDIPTTVNLNNIAVTLSPVTVDLYNEGTNLFTRNSSASIVLASANPYVVLSVKDEFGNNVTLSGSYGLTPNTSIFSVPRDVGNGLFVRIIVFTNFGYSEIFTLRITSNIELNFDYSTDNTFSYNGQNVHYEPVAIGEKLYLFDTISTSGDLIRAKGIYNHITPVTLSVRYDFGTGFNVLTNDTADVTPHLIFGEENNKRYVQVADTLNRNVMFALTVYDQNSGTYGYYYIFATNDNEYIYIPTYNQSDQQRLLVDKDKTTFDLKLNISIKNSQQVTPDDIKYKIISGKIAGDSIATDGKLTIAQSGKPERYIYIAIYNGQYVFGIYKLKLVPDVSISNTSVISVPTNAINDDINSYLPVFTYNNLVYQYGIQNIVADIAAGDPLSGYLHVDSVNKKILITHLVPNDISGYIHVKISLVGELDYEYYIAIKLVVGEYFNTSNTQYSVSSSPFKPLEAAANGTLANLSLLGVNGGYVSAGIDIAEVILDQVDNKNFTGEQSDYYTYNTSSKALSFKPQAKNTLLKFRLRTDFDYVQVLYVLVNANIDAPQNIADTVDYIGTGATANNRAVLDSGNNIDITEFLSFDKKYYAAAGEKSLLTVGYIYINVESVAEYIPAGGSSSGKFILGDLNKYITLEGTTLHFASSAVDIQAKITVQIIFKKNGIVIYYDAVANIYFKLNANYSASILYPLTGSTEESVESGDNIEAKDSNTYFLASRDGLEFNFSNYNLNRMTITKNASEVSYLEIVGEEEDNNYLLNRFSVRSSNSYAKFENDKIKFTNDSQNVQNVEIYIENYTGISLKMKFKVYPLGYLDRISLINYNGSPESAINTYDILTDSSFGGNEKNIITLSTLSSSTSDKIKFDSTNIPNLKETLQMEVYKRVYNTSTSAWDWILEPKEEQVQNSGSPYYNYSQKYFSVHFGPAYLGDNNLYLYMMNYDDKTNYQPTHYKIVFVNNSGYLDSFDFVYSTGAQISKFYDSETINQTSETIYGSTNYRNFFSDNDITGYAGLRRIDVKLASYSEINTVITDITDNLKTNYYYDTDTNPDNGRYYLAFESSNNNIISFTKTVAGLYTGEFQTGIVVENTSVNVDISLVYDYLGEKIKITTARYSFIVINHLEIRLQNEADLTGMTLYLNDYTPLQDGAGNNAVLIDLNSDKMLSSYSGGIATYGSGLNHLYFTLFNLISNSTHPYPNMIFEIDYDSSDAAINTNSVYVNGDNVLVFKQDFSASVRLVLKVKTTYSLKYIKIFSIIISPSYTISTFRDNLHTGFKSLENVQLTAKDKTEAGISNLVVFKQYGLDSDARTIINYITRPYGNTPVTNNIGDIGYTVFNSYDAALTITGDSYAYINAAYTNMTPGINEETNGIYITTPNIIGTKVVVLRFRLNILNNYIIGYYFLQVEQSVTVTYKDTTHKGQVMFDDVFDTDKIQLTLFNEGNNTPSGKTASIFNYETTAGFTDLAGKLKFVVYTPVNGFDPINLSFERTLSTDPAQILLNITKTGEFYFDSNISFKLFILGDIDVGITFTNNVAVSSESSKLQTISNSSFFEADIKILPNDSFDINTKVINTSNDLTLSLNNKQKYDIEFALFGTDTLVSVLPSEVVAVGTATEITRTADSKNIVYQVNLQKTYDYYTITNKYYYLKSESNDFLVIDYSVYIYYLLLDPFVSNGMLRNLDLNLNNYVKLKTLYSDNTLVTPSGTPSISYELNGSVISAITLENGLVKVNPATIFDITVPVELYVTATLGSLSNIICVKVENNLFKLNIQFISGDDGTNETQLKLPSNIAAYENYYIVYGTDNVIIETKPGYSFDTIELVFVSAGGFEESRQSKVITNVAYKKYTIQNFDQNLKLYLKIVED